MWYAHRKLIVVAILEQIPYNGLVDAERRFNRIKGYKHLPQLLAALDRLVAPPTLDANRKRA